MKLTISKILDNDTENGSEECKKYIGHVIWLCRKESNGEFTPTHLDILREGQLSVWRYIGVAAEAETCPGCDELKVKGDPCDTCKEKEADYIGDSWLLDK